MSWWARQWEKFFKHMRGGQGVMFMSPNCLQCLFRNASSHVGIIPCHTHSDTSGIHCDHFEHMAGKIYCFHCSCFEVFCTACITCLAHPNATMGQSSVSEASSCASTVQHIGKVWHSKVPCFSCNPSKDRKVITDNPYSNHFSIFCDSCNYSGVTQSLQILGWNFITFLSFWGS